MLNVHEAIRDQFNAFCHKACLVRVHLDMAGSDEEKEAVYSTYCRDNCTARQFMKRLVGDNDV